jgi:hypothetical protein
MLHYTELCDMFGTAKHAATEADVKTTMKLSVRTEITGLAVCYLQADGDKVALRGSMQSMIKHLKKLNAQHESPEEAKHPPTRVLAEILKAKIVAALKLK